MVYSTKCGGQTWRCYLPSDICSEGRFDRMTAEDIKSITIVSTDDWSIRRHCRRRRRRRPASPPTTSSSFSLSFENRPNYLLPRSPIDISNGTLHKLSTPRRNRQTLRPRSRGLSLAILLFNMRKKPPVIHTCPVGGITRCGRLYHW